MGILGIEIEHCHKFESPAQCFTVRNIFDVAEHCNAQPFMYFGWPLLQYGNVLLYKWSSNLSICTAMKILRELPFYLAEREFSTLGDSIVTISITLFAIYVVICSFAAVFYCQDG